MNVFLDTSALVKLYHEEEGSSLLERFLAAKVTGILISQLSKIEFSSTIWKKVRSTLLINFTETEANAALNLFENNQDEFSIIYLTIEDFEFAKRLITRCNVNGYALRTLDALQLTSALKVGEELDGFITFDRKLSDVAHYLQIPVIDIL